MTSVGLFEAKAKLSELCERVARTGEVVMITKRGRAVARLVPIGESDENASVWRRRERFVGRNGAIREDLDLPPRLRGRKVDLLK